MGLTWAWVFWMHFGRFVCVVWVGFGGTVVRMLFRWLHCRQRSKSWKPPRTQSLQKHLLHKVYPRFAARFLRMDSCGAELHSGCRFCPEFYSKPVEPKDRCQGRYCRKGCDFGRARCERRLGRFRIVGPCERSQPTRQRQSWRLHGAGGAEQR